MSREANIDTLGTKKQVSLGTSLSQVEHLAVATAGLSCALPTPEATNLTGSGAEKIIFLISLGLRTWTLLQENLRHVAGVVPNHPRPAMKNEKTCQLNV